MTSATLTINDQRVINFFNAVNDNDRDFNGNFIGSAKSKTGYLYVTGDNDVQVVLPVDLTDYANAASGNMSGGRPVGIRVKGFDTAESAAKFVTSTFSDINELVKFINSSKCDAVAYTDGAPKSSKASIKIGAQMAKDAIYAIHGDTKGFAILKGIRNAHFNTKERAAIMIKLFNETPFSEIELTYGNPADNYSLSAYAE